MDTLQMVKKAQQKLRATQLNWQEQCLFDCDDILSRVIRDCESGKPPTVGRKSEGCMSSEWRETGIICPFCGGMTYSTGQRRPQCGNDDCLCMMPDEYIWEWLITLPEFRLGFMERMKNEMRRL